MLSNTDYLFHLAKEFQDLREALTSAFEASVRMKEKYKGSAGYQEEIKKLQADYDSQLSALRDEYRYKLSNALGYMSQAISKRTVKPPTNEQLLILELLKMRKKPTEEECSRAAQAVSDNPIAVKIVSEIAQEVGIMRNYDNMCPEMSTEAAMNVINTLAAGIKDFISFDTTKASRMENRIHVEHYGGEGRPLTKRALFSDKEGCYMELAKIDEETLKKFSDIVDNAVETREEQN